VRTRTKKKRTLMPFENLHDLSALEVPEVNFVVLAPRDNPLPSGHTKASDDAKFCVAVAYIRFETAGGVIVPQTDRVVVCRGQDIL
jgi:hypothetical protein